MKRKIYSASILAVYLANFNNNHSKFIHKHPTRLEDLHKEFTIEGKNLTLIGQDDEDNGVLHEASTGHYYVAPMKMVKAGQNEVIAKEIYPVEETIGDGNHAGYGSNGDRDYGDMD